MMGTRFWGVSGWHDECRANFNGVLHLVGDAPSRILSRDGAAPVPWYSPENRLASLTWCPQDLRLAWITRRSLLPRLALSGRCSLPNRLARLARCSLSARLAHLVRYSLQLVGCSCCTVYSSNAVAPFLRCSRQLRLTGSLQENARSVRRASRRGSRAVRCSLSGRLARRLWCSHISRLALGSRRSRQLRLARQFSVLSTAPARSFGAL